MTALPRATRVLRRAAAPDLNCRSAAEELCRTAADCLTLTHEARFLRRRRLVGDGGLAFLADLPETTDLQDGDALVLEDGRHVAIRAADEPLLEVRGPRLARLAWHIGNRHTPCEIADDCLRLRVDHVLRAMLEGLGAEVTEVEAPFRPEGGAYGAGRPLAHSHGPHDPADSHSHD